MSALIQRADEAGIIDEIAARRTIEETCLRREGGSADPVRRRLISACRLWPFRTSPDLEKRLDARKAAS